MTLHANNAGSSELAEALHRFNQEISNRLPHANLLSRYSDRVAYATDASFYHLLPQLVVVVEDFQQSKVVIEAAYKYKVAITFRAAGTSLSGQSISDSVLVVLSNNWNKIEISDSARSIKLAPSVVAARANRALKKFAKKIGPDPASIDSCKIAGIAANNSSGMCCGVSNNSYHTVKDMNIIFSNGSNLDTACKKSVNHFINNNEKMIVQINQLATDVKNNLALSKKIKHKYRLKNTTGYGINALIDFEEPIEIIKHLMIGSEGTLGFIADITYKTLDINQHNMTGFYLFPNVDIACKALNELITADLSAIEMLDGYSLSCVSSEPVLEDMQSVISKQSFGLLLEVDADCDSELANKKRCVEKILKKYSENLVSQIELTNNASVAANLWRIRKGIFPSIGANRAPGTTIIIEDIAVEHNDLAKTLKELRALFERFDYHDAVIFGHAKDGNLHFAFSQSFETQQEVARYQSLLNHVVELVVEKMDGSLKAEHGTGRNMAPFVEKEWGSDAYQIMIQIKQVFDPNNILNPGVVINNDPDIHLKNLKPMPLVDSLIDQCIECGFCEPVCPSSQLSYSPRQRISVAREIERLRLRTQLVSPMINQLEQDESKQEKRLLKSLISDFQYSGIETCAGTGMCETRCPVNINTGEFIKGLRFRTLSKSLGGSFWSSLSAKYYALYRRPIRWALNLGWYCSNLLGTQRIVWFSRLINRISAKRIPIYFEALPGAESTQNCTDHKRKMKSATERVSAYKGKQVVYFPACSGRLFASDPKAKDKRSVFQATASVLTKAGFEVITPNNLEALCCGLPWDSQGNKKQAKSKNEELKGELKRLTNGGLLPVITDASPCSLFNNLQLGHVQIFDSIDFIAQFCLDKIDIQPSEEPVALHITCSSQRAGISERVIQVAKLCTSNLILPRDISCCGFAGEKGLLQPELNRHALQSLASQLPEDCHMGVSNSRTCELGLSRHTGIPFQSLIYLLDRASQSKS
jgi:D-lactate dehydrogenase